MPAISDSRQPNPALKWFATTAGQDLVAAETDGIAQVIAGCPALPWVWMGAPDIAAPEPGRRGLLLRRVADHPGAGRGELVLDGGPTLLAAIAAGQRNIRRDPAATRAG